MIYGSMNTLEKSVFPKALYDVLQAMRGTDYASVPDGTLEMDSDRIFAIVGRQDTMPREQKRPERHLLYADIHYMIQGQELNYFYNIPTDPVVTEDRLQSDDIAFLASTPRCESVCLLQPGDFSIFFPNDAHVPCCCVRTPESVRKAVVKVRMDVLTDG